MKTKAKLISKRECRKWITISNLFSKSLIPEKEALKQFNMLDAKSRNHIKQEFNVYDEVRRRKIAEQESSKEEKESAFKISVMVDAHIIATEYGIDPLTVIMCINPPCKVNENIIVR